MTEISYIILAVASGVLLGIIFFAGLWFTVKKAVVSKIPALWIFCSFFFRVGIALTGFYFIGAGNWQQLLACMLGFIASRFLVIHYTKSIDEKALLVKKEANYET